MFRRLLLAVLLACPGIAHASDGIVELSWNACSPIVQDLSTTTPGTYSVYVSVRDFDAAHIGYLVEILYGNTNQTVPDAWRFDPAGCQESTYPPIDFTAPPEVAQACPSLLTSLVGSINITQIGLNLDRPAWPATNMRLVLAIVYRPGSPGADPSKRYFLARIRFDHTKSVVGDSAPWGSCGGLEQSMCFKLGDAQYAGQDDIVRNFGRSTPTPTLSFNSVAACVGATPAHATTWGWIRGAYR